MASTLQNAINFFREFGLFDVILPFLFVFTVVYALLEKTRILGEDTVKGEKIPKRSLNSTVSFVVAMLVVATNKVVTAINAALPNVVLLIVLLICFLMLVGMFYKEGEFDFAKQYAGWTTGFAVVILIFIVLIFADSITYSGSESWLDYLFNYVVANFSGAVIGSIIMFIIVISAVVYITRGGQVMKKEG